MLLTARFTQERGNQTPQAIRKLAWESINRLTAATPGRSSRLIRAFQPGQAWTAVQYLVLAVSRQLPRIAVRRLTAVRSRLSSSIRVMRIFSTFRRLAAFGE